MDFATRNWFGYINENIRLDEGLRDIGLSEYVADAIESSLHEAPESAKTWLGHMWKKTHLHQFVRPSNRIQEFRFNTMEPLLSALDYWTEFAKQEDLDPPEPEVDFGSAEEDPFGGSPEEFLAAMDRHNLTEGAPEVQFENILREGENWTTEKAKRTRFILQSINRTIKDDALGKWRKAFEKAVKGLSKLGLNSKTVEFVQEVLDSAIEQAWKQFQSRFNDVFTFLNMHPDNIRILREHSTMIGADNKAEEEIAEQESPDQVYHTFDDGSYWYDLETSNCDLEGTRMGHCGAAQSGGTLYSLRKPEGKRGKSKSYVTIEFDGETISQMKGRGNSAPPEATWSHIEWFIDNMGVTEVTEQGEYSDSPEDFEEMNHFLESRTNANFQGSRENRMEEIAGDLNGIDYEYSGMDYCQVWWEWMDSYDDGNEIYVDMGAECKLEIDLGWPHFAVQKTGIVPLDADGNIITSFQMIPTTYSEQNDFVADIGLDDVSNLLPGEDNNGVEIEVKMMQGVIPDDWEPPEDFPNAEYPETAHLIATLRRSETVDGASAVHDYSYFANEIRDEFEEKYAERVKSVTAHLQIEGYIRENAYVKDLEKLEKINELKHWKVMADDTGAQFTFLADRDGEGHYRLPTGLAVPTETMIYLTAGERESERSLIQRMFPNLNTRGGGELRAPSLNSQMAHRLSDAYGSAQRAKMAATGQEEFDFGPQYEPKPVMELAKDIELIIYPTIRHDVRELERVPTLSFDFTFLVRVDFDDNVEEIDSVLAMLHHINDNPDIVREAARDILLVPMSEMGNVVHARKHILGRSNTVTDFFQKMDSVYGAQADAGDDMSERFMLISMWLRDNWEQMDLLERFVADAIYITPMLARTFRGHSMAGAIDPDTGKPRNWDEYVQKERVRRGVGLASKETPVNESIEDQIARIEGLLAEDDKTYDLRIYRMRIDVSISKDLGGEMQETQTEIRGIDGVTTVRTLGDTVKGSGSATLATLEIKFELLGSASRVKYRDRILIPALGRIKGITVLRASSIHRTNTRGTIRTVRETIQNIDEGSIGNFGAGGFGGMGAALGSVGRPDTPAMPTPRPQLQGVLEDWMEGSVKVYDVPMDSTDMRYHVMLPVEELFPFMDRYYRGDMADFEGRYKEFIKSGATAPVYVAVGQNGRIKITGNEDLVWFAKKSGLEELPIFLSYQKQV